MPTILPSRVTRLARLLPAVAAALLAVTPAAGAESQPPAQADSWVAFEATWSAAGQRRVLRAGERETVTTYFSGALAVLEGKRLPKGFRGEALFYSDGGRAGVGTLVLTDDRSDQLICDLVGEAAAGGARVRGTIRGGTGAYSGVSGDLSFRWRQLVKTPEGEVQGLAEEMRGRYRRPARAPATASETPR
jgi:hypothetical protein